MKTAKNPRNLSPVNKFRKSITDAATRAQDRMDKGLPVTAMEAALARALDAKFQRDRSFPWRAA